MIRSTQGWKDYLDRLAEFDRSDTVSELVDRAIVRYARHIGFSEMPPRR